jgi:DNA-binding HxlR family transcriptional regulator
VERPVERRAIERRSRSRRPLPSHRQWTPLGRSLEVVGDNWTLAIIAELAAGRTRLAVLREHLSGVSAGVLDRYLHRMDESGLVTRLRFTEMPPRVELELTEAGRELLPIAAALSRWGLRWSWSLPREGEIVDPDALVRTLAALLTEPVEAPDGAIELVLEQRGGRRRHVAEIVKGVVTMRTGDDDGVAPQITATIAGDWRAWTDALGPAADLSSLKLSGRRTQAQRLLAAIVRPRAGDSGDADLGRPGAEDA